MTPLFSKDENGYFITMPIMMMIMDESHDVEAKIYYDVEHDPVTVERFETPSHGLTAHLNTLLVQNQNFADSIADSIQVEIDLENEHSEVEASA